MNAPSKFMHITFPYLQLEFLVNMPPELLSQVFEEMKEKYSSVSAPSASIVPTSGLAASSAVWWKPAGPSHSSSDGNVPSSISQPMVVARLPERNESAREWSPEPISDIITALKTWVAYSNVSDCQNDFPTDSQIEMLVDFGRYLIVSKQGDKVSLI
jgi:hypothetical protein